ncbi:MAG: type I polyketide synthase, partial [Planctomycetota bacterium]
MSDTPERDEAGAWRTELVRLAPDRRQAWLLANVRAAAARFLALPGDEPVGADTPWTGLGFDSLRAIDFTAWLARATGVALRSTLLFDEPTPERVARHLLAALGFAPATLPLTPTSCAAPRATPPDREPIAIVGAACRVPGAETLEEFWQLLCDGRDAVAPIPRERFDVDALYDPDPAAEGRMYVREAGLLREHDGFDPAPFALSPREAVMLDPQQRWLLETTWHALEHANLPPRALAGARVGVYVAVRASEYFDSQSSRTTADASAWTATGNAVSTAAGRLSYTFGFRGPCYAFDTACSGSLVAVHLAVRALRARECDVAIAGGVNAILDPVAMVGLCRARMLSADGRCKAFDARADGYGRGEGCGVIVVKRLADALAAGDRVLAVVRGTAINQDGRSSGLTVPHGPAQSEVIRDALADAGVAPSDIDFVEAHGTGTQLGDPIEVQALDSVFAQRGRPLPIGTVKTNVGHLEAAAGIAGLLKAVLALRARVLPATLHFQRGNPHIDWARTVAQVVTRPSPLRKDGAPLFAGVSSFGFSGTNCHVVLASPPDDIAAPPDLIPDRPWLLPLQAMDAAALRALAVAHANALAAPATDLAAWCHAAAAGRTPLP